MAPCLLRVGPVEVDGTGRTGVPKAVASPRRLGGADEDDDDAALSVMAAAAGSGGGMVQAYAAAD